MAVHAELKLVERDEAGIDPQFRDDVVAGLREPQKAIPARWLYDRTGSEIFEEITWLPEYYPTRTETALLADHACEIANLVGPGRTVVEFGSGSSTKTPLLLLETAPAAYVPIDISGDFLMDSCAALAATVPGLPILPIEANFMKEVRLPGSIETGRMLGFFPGSTIGNFVPSTAVDLLRSMRATLGRDSLLLIGFDRTKSVQRLIAAYDDADGVTARFNLNLLERINRELGADIPLQAFRHVARWNAEWSRIEMHLEALESTRFTVCGNEFSITEGETIHTENSHKFTPGQVQVLLQAGGWTVKDQWSDAASDFLIVLAAAVPERSAP